MLYNSLENKKAEVLNWAVATPCLCRRPQRFFFLFSIVVRNQNLSKTFGLLNDVQFIKRKKN